MNQSTNRARFQSNKQQAKSTYSGRTMLKDDAATCGEEEKDARIENSAAGDDNETMIEDDGGNNKSGAGSKNSDAATNASSAPAIVVADPSVPVASAANTASTDTTTAAMGAGAASAAAAVSTPTTTTTTAPCPATSTATQPAQQQQQQQLPPSTLTQQQLQQPHTITTPPKITLPPGQHSHSAPAPQIGPGWTQQLVQRRTPSGPYGKVDRYYVAPEGKRKLRSMNEVHRYLNSLMAGNTDVGNNSNNNNNNNANNTASYKQLRINTTTGGGSNNSRSSSAANSPRPPPSGNSPHNLSPRPPPTSGPGSGKGIDIHPFSRGSVIEVRYVKRKKVVRGDQLKKHGGSGGVEEGYGEESGIYGESSGYTNNWDEEEDDDESISDWFDSSDDDNDEDEANNDNPNEGSNSNNSSSNQVNNDHVYLADIIDRRSLHTHLENSNPLQKFKYYIHYRNFNRRMDEWITMERIVSPPSVGNARVRALKRKEDRRKREEEERKERERILKEAFSGGGIGRRDAVRNRSLEDLNKADGNATAAGTAVGVGGAVPNRKRLRRAASTGEGIGDTNYCDLAVSAGSAAALPSSTSMGETYEDPTGRLPRRPRREASVASGVGGTGAPSIATTTTTTSETSKSSSSGALVAPTIIAEEHTAIDVVTTIAAQTLDEHEGMDAAALKEHEEVTKVKNVNTLELGKYQMDTWYFSPLPKELLKDASAGGMIDVLYVDEFSLNFFTRKEELLRYQKKTLLDVGSGRQRRHPPGNEIYRCGNLSMFEVDGFEERLYCQNLCYIAKLFLDHKTLYFDVDPFLFYVLCEVDERGFHPVGYYSKEKYSDVGYNLACILTFPSHQRKGYGRFLIAFSYELSKKEEKVGSPEKPMSDLGQQAYIPYWTSTIVDFLLNHSRYSKSMSIMDIAKKTSIMAEDIIFALNTLGILKFVNGVYFIYAERGHLEELAKSHPVKEPRVDPSKLHWTPYINDVKRDKFSISSKKPSVEAETTGSSH